MADEKKYLLVTKCSEVEEHDGERWIDENEFNQIQQKGELISSGCEHCKLTVKDQQGAILVEKEGC